MKKKEIILSCVSVVFGIVVLIALAFPVYVSPVGGDNITLAETTFGNSEKVRDMFALNYILLAALLFNIAGLVCAGLQFIPQMKGKQVLRLVSFFLFIIGASIYLASNGSYNCGDADFLLVSSAIKLYKKGYAESVAGISGMVAGFAMIIICANIYNENKRKKHENNG